MAPILVLAGFMGSGKTTVGREAARLLGWRFIDLDRQVVAHAGDSIPAIFAARGERGFRQLECHVLQAVLADQGNEEGLVLALGGGTLTSPEAVGELKEQGFIVYLEIDADHAWKRVRTSDRPLARDRDSFDALLAERKALYERTADCVIPVAGRSSIAIAREVAQIMASRQGDAK